MRRHWAYLKYVLRHKWHVFRACRELRVPLRQAIVHDWTKFLPVEWFPYAHNFYNADGSGRQVRDETGAYNPTDQGIPYQRAWLHHQRARHHWQAWVVLGDAGYITPLPIPERYIREMIADWCGAGRAIAGVRYPHDWYAANRDKMKLLPETRIRVEQLLARLGHF
ncbi:hypothetical protein LCGC14_3064910 [marine sediment metagenome]|uniref:Uncharacterized protein n=1 Tax=marine sediment metagenome TaxID=412755 RepID=A0A0F8X657_9ZZZZ